MTDILFATFVAAILITLAFVRAHLRVPARRPAPVDAGGKQPDGQRRPRQSR